jgi:hypothetical protein
VLIRQWVFHNLKGIPVSVDIFSSKKNEYL